MCIYAIIAKNRTFFLNSRFFVASLFSISFSFSSASSYNKNRALKFTTHRCDKIPHTENWSQFWEGLGMRLVYS